MGVRMPLSDRQIRSIKAREKAFRLADEKGLYLEISPSGSKLWRWKYRFAGREKREAFGAFPEVSLSEARRRRDEGRSLLAQDRDPSVERKRRKATMQIGAIDSFEAVAAEYISTKMVKQGLAPATIKKANWFLKLLTPSLGKLPVGEVDPIILLRALQQLQNKEKFETAKKVRSFASRVFRFAVATGRAKTDPAALLKDALTAPKAKHYAAITKPERLGTLLRAIDAYSGYPTTTLALKIAPHVFLRPGELRQANWSEIDFAERIWRVPAERMKARREHAVPLSSQVVELLLRMQKISGGGGYVFPAFHTNRRPLCENTLNSAFRRMGFSKDEVTAHGLRATASTLLNESGKWNPDAIERALAHGDSNAVRGAYHRGLHWPERVEMAQWWSDYLDSLRSRKAGATYLA
jgi:integrase